MKEAAHAQADAKQHPHDVCLGAHPHQQKGRGVREENALDAKCRRRGRLTTRHNERKTTT